MAKISKEQDLLCYKYMEKEFDELFNEDKAQAIADMIISDITYKNFTSHFKKKWMSPMVFLNLMAVRLYLHCVNYYATLDSMKNEIEKITQYTEDLKELSDSEDDKIKSAFLKETIDFLKNGYKLTRDIRIASVLCAYNGVNDLRTSVIKGILNDRNDIWTVWKDIKTDEKDIREFYFYVANTGWEVIQRIPWIDKLFEGNESEMKIHETMEKHKFVTFINSAADAYEFIKKKEEKKLHENDFSFPSESAVVRKLLTKGANI